jgi:hypothetical protein
MPNDSAQFVIQPAATLRLPEPWLSLLSLDHAVNWEAISAIGQMVGAIAVVISLIYLAREIRRNARLARQSSLDTLNMVAGQLAQNPRLAQLFDRGIRDLKSLEGADRVSFEAFMLQWFHIFAEMYHQHLEGHLDPRVWREVETPMRDLINARPGIQAWWRLYSKWFGEEFVNYVNQIQQTATRHDD